MRDDAEQAQGIAELARWGQERYLNELDALMWRTERHPSDSMTGTVVVLLDASPGWERLRAAHERATRLVPRLRERVVDPVVPVGPPMWALDLKFDLDRHLSRAEVPAPGSLEALYAFAEAFAVRALDRDHPLWRAVLVEGLDGGRAAFVFQVQHALMDGGAATQLFARILARDREPMDIPMPPRPQTAAPGPAQVAGHGIVRELWSLRRRASEAARTAVSVARSPGDAAAYASSLARVVRPTAPSRSPLLAPGDRRTWRFGTLECGLPELKAAGKAADGTVNDAFVCAILGGLRRYHARLGVSLDDVPISMPVSVRTENEVGGNRFTGAFFSAPSSVDDPRERIVAMRTRVAEVRSEPALDFMNTVMPVFNRAPSPLAAAAVAALNKSSVLTTSSWRGVEHPVFMTGARLDRMFVFGPLPGTRLTAAMNTHVGVCCIGINADGGVFKDAPLLWECMQEGLNEILALASGGE